MTFACASPRFPRVEFFPALAWVGGICLAGVSTGCKALSCFLAIFLIVLVDILGLTIILPLLPFYAEHLGASATVVGMLISSYALCQLIAGPVLGSWSDHIGRKPLLIVSQMGH